MRRGFTLIECIISSVILFLGFLAVAAVFPASYRGATLSQNHSFAIRVAQNVLESIRAHPYGSPVTTVPVTLQGMVEGVLGTTTFTPTVSFQNGSADGSTPSTASFDIAQVTVTWREGTGPSSAGVDKTFILAGGISRAP